MVAPTNKNGVDMHNKQWVTHLEAARTGLVSAFGFDSVKDYMQSVHRKDKYKPFNFNKRGAESLRCFIPYCIQRIDEGGALIILNREYKPLGHTGKGGNYGGMGLDYFAYTASHSSVNDPDMNRFLDACGPDSAGRDWLWFTFNDMTAPWNSSKDCKALIKKIDAVLGTNENDCYW